MQRCASGESSAGSLAVGTRFCQSSKGAEELMLLRDAIIRGTIRMNSPQFQDLLDRNNSKPIKIDGNKHGFLRICHPEPAGGSCRRIQKKSHLPVFSGDLHLDVQDPVSKWLIWMRHRHTHWIREMHLQKPTIDSRDQFPQNFPNVWDISGSFGKIGSIRMCIQVRKRLKTLKSFQCLRFSQTGKLVSKQISYVYSVCVYVCM